MAASGVRGTPTFYIDGARYDDSVALGQMLEAMRAQHPDLEVAGTAATPRGFLASRGPVGPTHDFVQPKENDTWTGFSASYPTTILALKPGLVARSRTGTSTSRSELSCRSDGLKLPAE